MSLLCVHSSVRLWAYYLEPAYSHEEWSGLAAENPRHVRVSSLASASPKEGVPRVYAVVLAQCCNGRGVFTAALTVAVFRASENKFLRSYNRTVK